MNGVCWTSEGRKFIINIQAQRGGRSSFRLFTFIHLWIKYNSIKNSLLGQRRYLEVIKCMEQWTEKQRRIPLWMPGMRGLLFLVLKERSCRHERLHSISQRMKMNVINPKSLDCTIIKRFIDTSCARFRNNNVLVLSEVRRSWWENDRPNQNESSCWWCKKHRFKRMRQPWLVTHLFPPSLDLLQHRAETHNFFRVISINGRNEQQLWNGTKLHRRAVSDKNLIEFKILSRPLSAREESRDNFQLN